jgi:FkbM family methyltransferase
MAKRGFKKGLFRLLGPRLYARLQAEFFFRRARRALGNPRYAETFFGRDLTAFAARLRPGDTVLDIGAYLGGTAALFAQAVGHTGRVISFEPYHHGYLRRLIDRLGLAGIIRPVVAALAAEKGSIAPAVPLHEGVPLYSQAGIIAFSGAAAAAPDILQGESVPMLRLDDFLAEEGLPASAVAAVKIDVEGSEPGVFQGGEKFFRGFEGFILCELWLDVMPPPGWLRLKSLGYHCRYLGRDGRWLEADTEAELRAATEGETYGNFWFERITKA